MAGGLDDRAYVGAIAGGKHFGGSPEPLPAQLVMTRIWRWAQLDRSVLVVLVVFIAPYWLPIKQLAKNKCRTGG